MSFPNWWNYFPSVHISTGVGPKPTDPTQWVCICICVCLCMCVCVCVCVFVCLSVCLGKNYDIINPEGEPMSQRRWGFHRMIGINVLFYVKKAPILKKLKNFVFVTYWEPDRETDGQWFHRTFLSGVQRYWSEVLEDNQSARHWDD